MLGLDEQLASSDAQTRLHLMSVKYNVTTHNSQMIALLSVS